MIELAATRAFLGWDADLWTALGAILGAILVPLVVGSLGFWWARVQQQTRWASERFHVDGIQKLHGRLTTLLSLHLQNFQIGSFIIRTVKTLDRDHPLAPTPDEIPQFLGRELDTLPFDSVLPVQELLGDRTILEWTMLAISDVTLEAKEGESQIRQPVVAYYRADASSGVRWTDLNEAIGRMTAYLEAWNKRVETHFALLDRLGDLDRHLGRKRPWTQGGYYAVKDRKEVLAMVTEIQDGYRIAKQAHKVTDDTLRSGGEIR